MGYQANMVTVNEFKNILEELYKKNYILIDIESLIKENTSTDSIDQNRIVIPAGKKPLIISIDDVNYFFWDKKDGFAEKLLFDENDSVATLVEDSEGNKKITREGDIIPILDDFILSHPDFSFLGAKGIIALTGFRGVLGYKTYDKKSDEYFEEFKQAKKIANDLKLTGWKFANHSFSHNILFKKGLLTKTFLKNDIERWRTEVSPIVGETKIFIGPFGQIFSHNDPRRNLLIENNYNILCGVDANMPLYSYKKYFVSYRANIDGYRMINNPDTLSKFFDLKNIYDESRPVSIKE
jgi:hypothetical protein